MTAETRRTRVPKRNGKGQCVIKIGGRGDYRTFKFSRSVSDKEVEDRTIRLKEVYDVCGGWNDLSNFIADEVRKGSVPVPLPAMDLSTHLWHERLPWVPWRSLLVHKMPSIPWATLGESRDTTINKFHLAGIRQFAINQLEEQVAIISDIDGHNASEVRPIAGHLQEALTAYENYVQKLQPSNKDRHSKIRQLKQRHPDQPLATLGIESCRKMIDYWRQRPPRHDGRGNYTEKRSGAQLRELGQFFNWLHVGDEFNWTEPENFLRLSRSIAKEKAKKQSIQDGGMATFSLEDLKRLIQVAKMPEKLWIVWCLNTSHGAAEVGRVLWEDLYLDQDHPWKTKGLNIWEGGNWVGILRPKTDVLGWWLLWPETVALLKDWRKECERILGREVRGTDRLIISESGNPLYRDQSKNGQSGFASHFKTLKADCERLELPVADLPPGTLRNQFSDWCGGDEGNATVASVALAHGIPHEGDKLLYKHYANRPWRKLFEKQLEYREYCASALKAAFEPPPLPQKQRKFLELWPTLSGAKAAKVAEAAKKLKLSNATVYRYLKQLNEVE